MSVQEFDNWYRAWLRGEHHSPDGLVASLKACEYCGDCEYCLKAKEEAAVEYSLLFPEVWKKGWVVIYRTSREYGGPEEGGWYYTHYTLEDSVPFIDNATRADAVALADKCYQGKNVVKCTEWFLPGHKETIVKPHYQ